MCLTEAQARQAVDSALHGQAAVRQVEILRSVLADRDSDVSDLIVALEAKQLKEEADAQRTAIYERRIEECERAGRKQRRKSTLKAFLTALATFAAGALITQTR